ncbi:MAG TPA: glycerate kinase [Ktedonobacterales bacterium]
MAEALDELRLVIAPQALKGSLDAVDVAQAIAVGVRRVASHAEIALVPLADGGEGLTHALVEATGGRYLSDQVTGPLGDPVDARWGILGKKRVAKDRGAGGAVAVIEMAAAAGLPLVPVARRDPGRTTTRGVGELILRALEAGCDEIILGLGGSATNDGGAGMAQALGVRLLDANGAEIGPGGAALARLARIEMGGLDPRLVGVRITAACDVTNPLLGAQGASAVYGPQKGATPAQVVALDAALAGYAEIMTRDVGRAVAEVPGAGAAGGLGAGLLAFTNARLMPGAPLVMEMSGFFAALESARLVITAEGRLDAQTAYGKLVGAVAGAARQAGARVIALAGAVALDRDALAALGVDVALPLADGPLSLEDSMRDARRLLADAAERALRLMRLGAWIAAPDAPPEDSPAGRPA